MNKILLIFIAVFNLHFAFGQHKKENKESIFLCAEYQFLNYSYFNFGIGYQPQNNLINLARKHKKYSFMGWNLLYSKTLNNSDWGVGIQSVAYSASADGPFAIGIEGNYKLVNNNHHFGIKPLIGLSIPFVSLVYGYYWDFSKDNNLSQN